LFRFWPEKDRLPFMDIHQSGTRRDRYDYYYAFSIPEYWQRLDGRYHYDYCVLQRPELESDRLLDVLDADRAHWALVFLDDAAAVYVRRGGALEAVAGRDAYRHLPAGRVGLEGLRARCK